MEETRTFWDKSKDFIRKQGFYIVLFVCLLIVGTAIALTALPRDGEGVQQEVQENPSVESSTSGDESLAAKRTPLPTATPGPSATPAASAAPTATPQPTARPAAARISKGAAPVDGKISWGYATDALLYSRTLNQWTTHAGVDIAADVGTEVKAVLAGTVREVRKDDALGQLVTVEHTNNRISLYANLDESVPVKEGQKVNAGDVLGTVGKTSVAECGDAPHLHFGFLVDNVPADPADHVAIGA